MVPERDRQDKPLCRFGPGGDYVRDWPGRTTSGASGELPVDYDRHINRLKRRDDTACGDAAGAGIATKLEPGYSAVFRLLKLGRNAYETCCKKRPLPGGCHLGSHSRSGWAVTGDPYPSAGANPASDRKLSRQEWLFPNIAGDGSGLARKQGNRFRACRSSGTKGPAAPRAKQGTLFDA